MAETPNSVSNETLINVFRMLTDRLDTLEDMIEKNHKEQLRHFYSNRTGACEGWIFDVHCPVVHLNGNERLNYNYPETKKEYNGICSSARLICNIYVPEGEEWLPTDLISKLKQQHKEYSIYRRDSERERTTSIKFYFNGRDILSAWSTSQMFIDTVKNNFKLAKCEHVFEMVDEIIIEYDI